MMGVRWVATLLPVGVWLWTGTKAWAEEDHHNHPGRVSQELHVVALVEGHNNASQDTFLHSACRLGFPSVQVLSCAAQQVGCQTDAKVEHHLSTLPEDDLVIVTNLRGEFVYLVGRYEEARSRVAAAGTNTLIAAVFPVLEEEEEEDQKNVKDERQHYMEEEEEERNIEEEGHQDTKYKETVQENHQKGTKQENEYDKHRDITKNEKLKKVMEKEQMGDDTELVKERKKEVPKKKQEDEDEGELKSLPAEDDENGTEGESEKMENVEEAKTRQTNAINRQTPDRKGNKPLEKNQDSEDQVKRGSDLDEEKEEEREGRRRREIDHVSIDVADGNDKISVEKDESADRRTTKEDTEAKNRNTESKWTETGLGGKQNEEEKVKKNGKNLLIRSLRGGTVLGRVGTLLKALRNQEVAAGDLIAQDTTANYVLFGSDRTPGALRLELPLQVKFFPSRVNGEEEEEEEEEEVLTEPLVVYSRHEEFDFHNILEVEAAQDGAKDTRSCSSITPAQEDGEGPPRVLVGVLLGGQWAPFLEEVLAGLALQDYPKEAMSVWLFGKRGQQEVEISAFAQNNEGKYSSLNVTWDETPDHRLLRSRCEEASCTYVTLMESRVILDDPATLSVLVASSRGVVGPLLKQRREGGEVNFVVKREETSQWDDLIRRRSVRAVLRVGEVRALRLVHKDLLDDLLEGRTVAHYINTRPGPSVLLDPRGGHTGDKRHPDLWGITYNKLAWRRRYVHPQLHRIIQGEAQAEEVGEDLYHVPLFTERFCRDLVEEMEHYGRWQSKDDEDNREESHRYTSTNINLSQIGFASHYNLVINSLHKELLATLYGGYRAEGKASLLFVLKYTAATDYNTFKYHLDGATYTFNVALNDDFTGGGLEYRIGNEKFGEEREFRLAHNRTGWAVVQPNRPLHLHHGVPLLTGRRYALIAIVDTNDATSKGGPLW